MAARGGQRGDRSPGRTRDQRQEVASHEQMAELESTLLDLEGMLREIESVSSIIEFNGTSLGASPGGASSSERGLFRAAGGGAVVLAQSVAEDLKKWHERNEMHVVEYGAEHAERLRRSVQRQQAEQESREFVRTLVRQRLFDTAADSMVSSSKGLNLNSPQKKKTEVVDSMEAFSLLRTRVEATVAPLNSLRAEPPQEMLAACRASRSAVERKKQRAVGRRQRLPDLASHLDAALMDEVEQITSVRKADLQAQCDLQMNTLRMLHEAQIERLQWSDQMDGFSKAGATSSEPWKELWPAGIAAGTATATAMENVQPARPFKLDAQRKPVTPQLGPEVEEAISGALVPQLLTQGGVRIKQLRSEFFQSYLAKDSGERARLVGSELERWQLKTKIELLKDLATMHQTTHSGIMDQLRSSLEFRDDDPTDQLHRTLCAAETFHKQKASFFDDQVDSAETAISTFCNQSMEQLLSLRRRTELASLKRWNDVGVGLNTTLDDAWVKCQCQLVEQLQKSLSDSHKSVKLPIDNLDIERGRKHVDKIAVAWKRCGTQVPQQMSFVETITKHMPSTAESCTVGKAALTLLEAELGKISNKLKEPPGDM